MAVRMDTSMQEWLSSPDNPPVRYLTARCLLTQSPPEAELRDLRALIFDWAPLRRVLDLQLDDGGFPYAQRTPTAQPLFSALTLMQRCGLEITDEPVRRAVEHLTKHHQGRGVVSYTNGGSGVLPCYVGTVVTALIEMGAIDTEIVQTSIRWLAGHQRFDHKTTRAGGTQPWPYAAPRTFGCWQSVSCFHGVAATFRALAAVPPALRSDLVRTRLDEAIEYLRIHRLYKKSDADRSMFRHMTRFFLVGDYRSDLLDLLQGIADADPALVHQDWVRDALDDMSALTEDGRVPLVQNYGRKLLDPIPLEPVGAQSRFLTYQWLRISGTLGPEQ